jgi:DNA repair ATPase RecN
LDTGCNNPPGKNASGVQNQQATLMATIDERIQAISEEVSNIKIDVATVKVELRNLTKSFDRHDELQNESKQRVPNTLLGILAAGIGLAGLVIQYYIAKGP